LTVAVDAEPERAARFAAALAATTLVDADGELARVLRLRAIPCGFAFSREGELFGERLGGFDIHDDETVHLVRSWLRHEGAAPSAASRALGDRTTTEAQELFARGSERWRRGEREAALALWHAAYLRDPRSFIIRKQIWRALYPERFGDRLDLAWQKEQIAREDALGFAAANPGIPMPRGHSR
jgi:hypothetical protein